MRFALALLLCGIGTLVSAQQPAAVDSPEFHLKVALAALDDGNAEIALQELDAAAKLQPDNGIIQFTRALVLDKLDRADEALAALEEAEKAGLPDAYKPKVNDLRPTLAYKKLKVAESASASAQESQELQDLTAWLATAGAHVRSACRLTYTFSTGSTVADTTQDSEQTSFRVNGCRLSWVVRSHGSTTSWVGGQVIPASTTSCSNVEVDVTNANIDRQLYSSLYHPAGAAGAPSYSCASDPTFVRIAERAAYGSCGPNQSFSMAYAALFFPDSAAADAAIAKLEKLKATCSK